MIFWKLYTLILQDDWYPLSDFRKNQHIAGARNWFRKYVPNPFQPYSVSSTHKHKFIQIAIYPNCSPLTTASRCISQYLPSISPHTPPEQFVPTPVSPPFPFSPIPPFPRAPFVLIPLSQVLPFSSLHPPLAVMELPQFDFLLNFHQLAGPPPNQHQLLSHFNYSHYLILLHILVLFLHLSLNCSYLYNINIYIDQIISLLTFSIFWVGGGSTTGCSTYFF